MHMGHVAVAAWVVLASMGGLIRGAAELASLTALCRVPIADDVAPTPAKEAATRRVAPSGSIGAEAAHDELWRRFIDRHGVVVDFTDLDGSVDLPTPEECRDGKPNALGWFQPIENGGMFGGMYMDAAVLRWERTRSDADAAKARRLLEGLLTLNSVSDVKGFVARGLSTDGRSHYPMGSNDQTSPWFYGLWRYWQSGLATPDEKIRIRRHVVETADAIVKLGWRMPAEQPFGTRGGFEGHVFDASPRRLFVMKWMHDVTGDAAWETMYRRTLGERGGPDKASHLEICEKGMVFHYAKTHNWTSCTAVSALRCLWEMEDDPAVKAAFGRGLAASARLAAESLPEFRKFDQADPRGFDTDWRKAMMPLWKPQATEQEAQTLAEAQLRAFMKLSPRRHLETAFLREPASAAWIITLCPDEEIVRSHAADIRALADHFDYRQLYYSTFFWIEPACLRLDRMVPAPR